MRGVGADGDDVGARRHHLANQPLLEADQRAEQLARFLLVLARVGLDLGLRRSLLLLGRWRVVAATVVAAVGAGHQVRERRERPGDHGKRRQQRGQHELRVAAHDELRQQQEAHEDEHQHGRQEDPDAVFGASDTFDVRQQHRDDHRDDAEQYARREEQRRGILEERAQQVALTSRTLGHHAQREPHEGAEGRQDRAEVDGDAGEQEHDQRNHARRLPLDQSGTQSTLAPQARLEASHLAAVGLVVVPEQVQQAVQGEHLEFGAIRVPVARRLAPRDTGGDHDVAEVAYLPAHARPVVVGREREDVGGTVDAAPLAIEPAHGGIAGQHDGDRAARACRRGAGQPAGQPRRTRRAAVPIADGDRQRRGVGVHGEVSPAARPALDRPRRAGSLPPRVRLRRRRPARSTAPACGAPRPDR